MVKMGVSDDHRIDIGDHLGFGNAPLLACARRPRHAGRRVVHRYAGANKLHQILVGGDDQHLGAARARLTRICGDQIIRLVAILLDGDEAKGAHGFAHQGKLRDQVFRRLTAVALVGRIDFLAKRVFRLVENDGEMGRPDAHRPLLDDLEQLCAEQAHGPGGQFVRAVIVFRVLPHGLEEGAENEIGTVHEEDGVAVLDGSMDGRHVLLGYVAGRRGP